VKLTIAVTVKLDAEDVAALDEEIRRRERDNPDSPPCSRSFVLRALMRSALGVGMDAGEDETRVRARA
jgi:hypothetical protein